MLSYVNLFASLYKRGSETNKRRRLIILSVIFPYLPMVSPPSPNTANGGGVVFAYLDHKSSRTMEKILTIHLINFAVQTVEHLHALIITMGHLVK